MAQGHAKIADDVEELLAFCDYPVGHWIHLRTTSLIESAFATVRHWTKVTRGHGSRAAGIAMAFKLTEAARGALAPSTHPASSRWSAPGPASNVASSLNATLYSRPPKPAGTPV